MLIKCKRLCRDVGKDFSWDNLRRIFQLGYFWKNEHECKCKEIPEWGKVGFFQSGNFRKNHFCRFFPDWEFWEESILKTFLRLLLLGRIKIAIFLAGKFWEELASTDSNSSWMQKIFPGCDIHLFARIFTPVKKCSKWSDLARKLEIFMCKFKLLENSRPNGLLFSGELLETGSIHNSGYWKIAGLAACYFQGNSWKLGVSIIRVIGK